MLVCYFGTYEKDYPRNRLLINGLRKNKIKVIECNEDVWGGSEDKTDIFSLNNLLKKTIRLLYAYFRLVINFFKSGIGCQIVMAGYPGHFDMLLAYPLTRIFKQKLVFNPLISLYDTVVIDRKLVKKESLAANLILLLEAIVFRLNDLIITDTHAHSIYFRRQFRLHPNQKMVRILVGADEEKFPYSPYKSSSNCLKILFVGKFTPLHGIPTIIKAAHLLRNQDDIEFTIVGKGQMEDEIVKLARRLKIKNIKFISWIPYDNLHEIIKDADICLGIFDKGDKADRVIPNKIFQSLAVGRAVITRKSHAISEVFEDNKDIILCDAGDPESLANSIKYLKNNLKIRCEIAKNGHLLFKKRLNSLRLGKELKTSLDKLLES